MPHSSKRSCRSEEHTSELQSRQYLPSFPTRRSSDLSADSYAVLSGNADLWTSVAGYNQDLGISVSGTGQSVYPTRAGQPEAWKESGGFAGTFSPNAAFVQTVV